MKKSILLITALALMVLQFSTTSYSYSKDPVASLDGKEITKTILATYVNEVAGSGYEPWLNNDDGLRKLADYYINRVLLLDYAKQQIKKKDRLVTNHNARSVNADTMYLTSLLKTEVHEKAVISDESIESYLQNNQNSSLKQARLKLESERKKELLEQLVNKVRSDHEIHYF